MIKMMLYSNAALIAFGLVALLGFQQAQAQQSETFGQYEVHYSTLNTNQLTPQVAQAFGIQRAGTQAMLNISVIHRETGETVAAEVRARASNLNNQLRNLDMRELREQEAVYYIGQFRIYDEELLRFEVQIQPEGRVGPAFQLNFQKQFYTG